jgi:bifunctional DNase/RNase
MSDEEHPSRRDDEELPVKISGLMLDPSSNIPIVILRDEASKRFLPIWIGPVEADAIARRIEGQTPPRPMTHDLLRSSIEALGANVVRVVISDLRDTTFYAELHLERNGEAITVDARPSDAIALALRAEAPLFVRGAVMEKAQAVDLVSEASDDERLRKWLEEVSPEDLGKYTM